MDLKKIGQYLAELRKYYHMTEEDVARRMAVSADAVLSWEAGEALPALDVLVKLSEMYGVTVNDMFHADLETLAQKKTMGSAENDTPVKKIFTIGCGRWGTFLAWYLDRIGHDVSLYGRPSSARMKELMETRQNEHLHISDSLTLVTSYDTIADCDIVVISISAQQLQEVADTLKKLGVKDKILVLCMKGIEIETGRRLSQVVTDTVDRSNKVAVWLGPGHVQEFYRGVPNCMVIDSNDDDAKKELIKSFSSDLIRFYYGTDLLGNEIGAAAKNVVGIAAGMLEGAGKSSLKGALMARGTKEISDLIVAMGGKASSAYGLCHLGDYEATLFSAHSQNLAFGKSIVQGTAYHKLAEGFYTVKALCNLGKAYGVELPICQAIYQVLYENERPENILQMLFTRSLKAEF
ncbi:MAG: helix-turn-helix domain-containing protein [Firmicutes bacterium]|nr:helix-turn-helix domain-containing protein [Bacillota bacterium]